ncbi:hypothetical protein FS837_002030 [Tulasnella sp. UAMH 9824]|nr:hypothetical protein FS837_002030 [Tulasnella sp. UAMH 9824]
MGPASQINMGALARQYLPPRLQTKDSKPLPPNRGNWPTNPITRRPARQHSSDFHADILWGFAAAQVRILTTRAAFSIPSKHGTPDAQTNNAERAAVAAVRLEVDPVDIWDVSTINGMGKRTRETLSIGNFLIVFTSEAGKVLYWEVASEVKGVSFNENNHVKLQFSESLFDFGFTAGSRDEAEAIVRKAIRSKELVRTAPKKFLLYPPPSSSREGSFVVALYDFVAYGDDELTLIGGEKITVVDKEESDDWWMCRNSYGKEGRVPVSYLKARIKPSTSSEREWDAIDKAVAEVARAGAARKEQEQAAAAAAKARLSADESRRKREQEAREAQERQERQEAEARNAEARRQKEGRRRAWEAGRGEGEAQPHAEIILSTRKLPQNPMVLDKLTGTPVKSTAITSRNEYGVFEPNATVQPVLPLDSVSELSPWSAGSWESRAILSKFETMALIDDIGLSITWISPMPVKVNGHFCDVFEGIHVEVGKVALKRPRVDSTGYDDAVRFEREAATWRNLRHPHILKFLGTFRRDGHIYFVSPFINNGTLVEYIAARPGTNRIRLLCETADAIQYLHKEGVVHGDLKAGNILIEDDGYCLLCDFGLTRTVESRTSTAMRGAGTFRWQSPELWDNAPKSFESDVYAFGMTIAEVLTGEVPFHDLRNDVAVMQAVILRDERPSKIPVESSSGISYDNIWDVASACWPKTPGDRISMSEALHLIRADPSLSSSYR